MGGGGQWEIAALLIGIVIAAILALTMFFMKKRKKQAQEEEEKRRQEKLALRAPAPVMVTKKQTATPTPPSPIKPTPKPAPLQPVKTPQITAPKPLSLPAPTNQAPVDTESHGPSKRELKAKPGADRKLEEPSKMKKISPEKNAPEEPKRTMDLDELFRDF
jgi:hypothetical protein